MRPPPLSTHRCQGQSLVRSAIHHSGGGGRLHRLCLCVEVCPAKNKAEPSKKAINMEPQLPLREQERENWDFFLDLPNPDRAMA
jgi:hypothetical protein